MHKENPNGFREHSFLWRPEAAAINATRLDVYICQVRASDYYFSSTPACSKLFLTESMVAYQPNNAVPTQEDDASGECRTGDEPVPLEDLQILKIKPRRSLAQLRTLFSQAWQKHKLIHIVGDMAELMVLAPEEVTTHSKGLQKYMNGMCCVKEEPHSIKYVGVDFNVERAGPVGGAMARVCFKKLTKLAPTLLSHHVTRYDLFWDVPGHLTFNDRVVNDTWKPVVEGYWGCD